MKHPRKDNMSIQDASGRIPEDEPVFVIRARDAIGVQLVRDYASRLRMYGNPETLVFATEQWANEMEHYARQHGGTKLPSIPLDQIQSYAEACNDGS